MIVRVVPLGRLQVLDEPLVQDVDGALVVVDEILGLSRLGAGWRTCNGKVTICSFV